jgi:hypothetical protein
MRDLAPLLRELISGERAVDEARALFATDHWFSYRNFARTAGHVAQRLRDIGLSDVHIDPIPAENRTKYSGWTTMTAWDIDRGHLRVVSPESRTLADWDDIPQGVIMRSESARGTFPLVAWDGKSTDIDLRDKIAFTHARPAEAQHALAACGGRGMISDFLPSLPGVRDRSEALDDVLWEQTCFRPNPGGLFGFMISPRQGQWLDEILAQGAAVTVEIDLDARNYDGVTHAIDALLPADEPCGQDLLLVAHLYEPGGNDNCSGAALCIEVLRAIREAQRNGLKLKRNTRALFAYEGRGTVAWMHRHESDLRRMVAGLNIDEIGVDQTIGRSTAHVFLPPHSAPSFVGELLVDLCRTLLPPDIRWKPVGDRADIILDTRFSDPSVGVPTPCMIQYPAFTYHTSRDTPDVLSPRVMQAFGVVAGTYLARLATLGPDDARTLDKLIATNARRDADRIAEPSRRALLRERLVWKRRELNRFGIAQLSQVQEVIEALPLLALPRPLPGTGRGSNAVPHRTTLASPGGSQVADLLDPSLRANFRRNLLDHGLDLVFHHFFYWSDGKRTIEDICIRIEDELALSENADAIPRTTTSNLTHNLAGKLDRDAVVRMFAQLEKAGLMRLIKPSSDRV